MYRSKLNFRCKMAQRIYTVREDKMRRYSYFMFSVIQKYITKHFPGYKLLIDDDSYWATSPYHIQIGKVFFPRGYSTSRGVYKLLYPYCYTFDGVLIKNVPIRSLCTLIKRIKQYCPVIKSVGPMKLYSVTNNKYIARYYTHINSIPNLFLISF